MMVLEKKKTREELKQTYKDLKRSGASVETNNNNRTWKYTCVHMILILYTFSSNNNIDNTYIIHIYILYIYIFIIIHT